MRWMSRAVAIVAVLTPTLASATLAQRRADVSSARFSLAARRGVMPANGNAVQHPATPPEAGPDWSIFAGVASGDDPYDIGIAAGATAKWRRLEWPVAVRADGYYAHHSGDLGSQLGGYDISVNIFGVMGAGEYVFPTQNRLKPYVLGGLGVFYSSVNLDYDGVFEDDTYDSSADLGFEIGAGIKLTNKFGIELRFMDMGEFSTMPVLAVWDF